MKYQKILGLVATAGLFLAGCTTDSDTQNTWFSDPSAVRISASVGSTFARSNPTAGLDEGLKSFNSGDKIGAVSYTNRTLPKNRGVVIPGVGGRRKQNK